MNGHMILFVAATAARPQGPYAPWVLAGTPFLEFHLTDTTPAGIHVGLAL